MGEKRKEVLVVSQVSAAIVACESPFRLTLSPPLRQPRLRFRAEGALPLFQMSDNTSAPDCWEAAADENIPTIATSMSTLNVNAPVFIPNVNAPEFVPSFMKEETGQTQPAAPGKDTQGYGARRQESQGGVEEVGQVSVVVRSTSWRVTWRPSARSCIPETDGRHNHSR